MLELPLSGLRLPYGFISTSTIYMRRAARQDANHGEIALAFAACGYVVIDTSRMGDGFPDLLVGRRNTGQLWLVEVKDGSKPKSRRKLTKAEEAFHKRWPATRIVESVEDVLNWRD